MKVLPRGLTQTIKMYKHFLYALVLFLLFVTYFFKPFTIFVLDIYLSNELGKKVEITSLNFLPFKFNGHITIKTYPKGIDVYGVYRDQHLIMTSTSLGGLVRIKYKNYKYKTTIDSIDLIKFAELLGNKKHVKSGIINGSIYYDKRPHSGYTDLKVTDIVLYGLDLDKKLSTINDALQLNIQNIMSRTFLDDSSTSEITNIDHAQFNIRYKDGNITTSDVALRTERYRISIDGQVHKKGQIEYFDVSLIDKNGCSIITQSLKGNIKKPKVKKTSTAIVHVAKSVPSSFLGIGLQMMDYGKGYASQQNIIAKEDLNIPNGILLEADHYMQETSKIVMPLDCSIVYIGSVKPPMDTQKDSKKSPKFYLP